MHSDDGVEDAKSLGDVVKKYVALHMDAINATVVMSIRLSLLASRV